MPQCTRRTDARTRGSAIGSVLHNISARRFALKTEMKHKAIICSSQYGPWVGYTPPHIVIYDDCNGHTRNFTSLGVIYINDTGLKSDIVFTGSTHFQVKEIEVFEITE
jgi:hypothetical protein